MSKKHILYGHFAPSKVPPKIVTWLVRTKIVRRESQALSLLLVIMFASLFITIVNINTIVTGRFTVAQAAIINTLLQK